HRTFSLHQQRGGPPPPASASGAGRRGRDRRGDGPHRRFTNYRAARRGAQTRARRPGAEMGGGLAPARAWGRRGGAGPRLPPPGAGRPGNLPAGVEIVPVAANDRQLAPSAIVAALSARGFRRILIEGGADTVSRFLAARCLDRLHILVAPIIMGGGRSSLTLPP